MIKINQTLLTKLFKEPDPQPDKPEVKTVYNSLLYRIFPGKQNFIAFLTAQSFDKQYELAEEIIHHLCYESNFPPSYFALEEVICLEQFQKGLNDENTSRIPRDHYLHIVNLYLLGIYIFFYNQEFFKRIVDDNSFQRVESINNNHLSDCVKDFISEWKYFCLYHDIGYVQEIYGNPAYVPKPKESYHKLVGTKNDFYESFKPGNPVKQICFFSSCEVISRIMMWRLILDNSKITIKPKNKIFRSFKNKELMIANRKGKTTAKLSDYSKNELKELTRLEKIYSNNCLKPLIPVIGEENIVITGIHKKTGELALISFCIDGTRNTLYDHSYSGSAEITLLSKTPCRILHDDFVSSEYDLRYYVKNSRKETNLFNTMIFNDSNIDDAYEGIKSDSINISIAGLTSEEQFIDSYYAIYSFIYKKLKAMVFPPAMSDDDDSYSKSYKNALDKYIENLENAPNIYTVSNTEELVNHTNLIRESINEISILYYKNEIINLCIEYIKDTVITKDDIKLGKSGYNPTQAINLTVDESIKLLADRTQGDEFKKKLKNHTTQKFGQKIKGTNELLYLYTLTYLGFQTMLNTNSNKFAYSFAYKSLSEHFRTSVADSLFLEKAQEMLGTRFKSVNEIMSEYHLTFTKYDHGFSSMKYAASVFSLLRNSIKKRKNGGQRVLIDILFSIPDGETHDEYKIKYDINYNHIFENVLYAVFIHNLYPSHFSEESGLNSMKTNITTDPFTYFSLMCDALQQWNRPQSIHPAYLISKPYTHASENYNIIVKKSGIYLYEEGSEMYQRNISDNIDGMTHLENIKAYVKKGH